MLIGQLEHGNWNTERDNRNIEHDKRNMHHKTIYWNKC